MRELVGSSTLSPLNPILLGAEHEVLRKQGEQYAEVSRPKNVQSTADVSSII